ncbi:hypothetical protein LIER_07073 [Lithospermum erythrorhizon]|uniref:Protein ABCI12, chloroplastic n=1 Tax=Lithospermum erythrorhizon TaxID=34254 RepID=A0AAV3P6P7_LITER
MSTNPVYTNPRILFNSSTLKHQSTLNPKRLHFGHAQLQKSNQYVKLKCSANSGNGDGFGFGDAKNVDKKWERFIPNNFVAAEKVFRVISEATSSPITQYIASPTTFLHSVDPRIKLAWLVALVILPARLSVLMRFGLVSFLALVSISVQPRRVWMDQLGRVSLLSGILFITLALGTDTAPSFLSSRSPPSLVTGLPDIPSSLTGYSYVIMKLGPLRLTRKGLSVASTSACLTFVIFQSASLCLSTTTPEQLAYSLQWVINPLKYIGLPVSEVVITLLLSLRFISMVFDEVRNLALGIVSRRIDWKKLTPMETVDIIFTYIRRIFKNIFHHAEQISQAMIVRGFRGDSTSHKLFLSANSSMALANIVSMLSLVGLVGAAFLCQDLI